MKTAYLAKFSYGKASLASFKYEEETEVSYFPIEGQELHLTGFMYVGRRVSKETAFVELSDAINWLVDCAYKYVHKSEVALSKARDQVVMLESFSKESR